MKVRFFSVFTVFLLVAAGLVPSLMTGCGGSATSVPVASNAALSDATICKSFHQDAGPSDATSAFAPNDPWVLCAVKLTDGPSNTKVKAAWYYKGTLRYSQTQGVEGTKWLVFDLKPDNFDLFHFAAGSYTVKLYLNGEEKASLDFTVQ